RTRGSGQTVTGLDLDALQRDLRSDGVDPVGARVGRAVLPLDVEELEEDAELPIRVAVEGAQPGRLTLDQHDRPAVARPGARDVAAVHGDAVVRVVEDDGVVAARSDQDVRALARGGVDSGLDLPLRLRLRPGVRVVSERRDEDRVRLRAVDA